MVKGLNRVFNIGGCYVEAKGICDARKKAIMGNFALPDCFGDSLNVGSLAECMVANGWEENVVTELSLLMPETLIQTLDERYQQGLEVAPNTPFTTTQLRGFLLDYYDIDHPNPTAADSQS